MLTPQQMLFFEILGGFVAFAFLWRRREAIAHAVRGTVIAVACAAAAFVLLWKGGLSPLYSYFAALVVVVLVRRAQPSRSRHVTARTRRQAIAEFERTSGQTFNRRIHELDHKHPHSRGGGNSVENIQVLTRKKNRSKGAKIGWLDR